MRRFAIQNTQGKKPRQRARCWEVPAARAQSPPQNKVTSNHPKATTAALEGSPRKTIADCF